jgi:Protein of unknown function (DUF2490)
MKMKKLLLLIPLLCIGGFSNAQTEDFGSWMTFSVNKGIGEKFVLGLDQELRLRNNLTDINLIYTNVGLSYKVNKWFRISQVYRFIDKHQSDGAWGVRHRIYTDLIFKAKPADFTLTYRFRYQTEWRGAGYTSELGRIPEIYIRNLFKIGYKLNDKIAPYIGSELRFQVQNPRIPYHDGFDRTRFIAGTDYTVNDHSAFGLYFLLQKEWNVNDPQTLYILGLEYTISL